MTTQQIIQRMKVSRDEIRRQHNAPIKDQIKAIQRKMVEISFLPVPDIGQHKELLKQLQEAKAKLI